MRPLCEREPGSHRSSTETNTLKRLVLAAAVLAAGLTACGGDTGGTTGGGGGGGTGTGTNLLDCTGATAVTTTEVQSAIAGPRCVSCHNGSDPVSYPGDYSNAAKMQLIVGKDSPYAANTAGSTLKVVDPNHPENSSLMLKIMGGGAAHKGPKGEVVGGSMPQGSALLSTADQTKFRNWICTGAVQQ
ncbi:MAG: hypothetical protein ACJ790_21185 [Myxococcaceae bacterium]